MAVAQGITVNVRDTDIMKAIIQFAKEAIESDPTAEQRLEEIMLEYGYELTDIG